MTPEEEDSRSGSVTASPGVSDNSETVIYGIDGRCSITFTEPAEPSEPEKPDNRPHWLKTMRRGSVPRWKANRRHSAGFIVPEMFHSLELWSWRALFVSAAIIHFLHLGGAR
jgi:hypothetical protein